MIVNRGKFHSFQSAFQADKMDLLELSNGSLDESVSLPLKKQYLDSRYDLALKFFVNKAFDRSYTIIRKLYEKSFANFENGIISEELFIKIITLYFIQVGLLIDKRNKHDFKVSEQELQEATYNLKDNVLINNLLNVYGGGINSIPSEILYNLFLVYCVNWYLLSENATFLRQKYEELFYHIDYGGKREDSYLGKLFELYIFEALPNCDDYDEAARVIETNPLSRKDRDRYLKNLEKVKSKREMQRQIEENRRKEREQDMKHKMIQEAKKREERDQQHFKSLKSLSEEQNKKNSGPGKRSIDTRNKANIENIKDKFFYITLLCKDYLKNNSPLIIVILLLFAGSRFLGIRRAEVIEKLKRTLTMAFKISYL